LTPVVVTREEMDAALAPVRARSTDVVALARAFDLRTEGDYLASGEFLTTVVRPALDQIDEKHDRNVAAWNAGHKAALADKRRDAAPFLDAEAVVKAARERWRARQRELEREERLRLEREQQRAAEAGARAEARRLLEAGTVTAEREADQLMRDLGDGAIVPANPLPASVPRALPRTEGTTVRQLKRYRVVDALAIKRDFLVPDEVAIQRVVTALGERAEQVVGGIEVYLKDSEGVSSR
jgi:hypothetical protein